MLRDESTRLSLEQSGLKERIKENLEKVSAACGEMQEAYRRRLRVSLSLNDACADKAEQYTAIPSEQHSGDS